MSLYSTHTDEELLLLLKDSDEAAFAVVYDRYWKLMFGLAAAKLKDPEDAKELVQDVFISLWNRRSELNITHTLKSYLAAAIKFRVYSVLSKQYRQRELEAGLSEPETFTLPDIENKFSLDELMQKVELATARLPERCRLIFTMSREENMSHKEIADELQISEKTVDNQISKALNAFRMTLRVFFSSLL